MIGRRWLHHFVTMGGWLCFLGLLAGCIPAVVTPDPPTSGPLANVSPAPANVVPEAQPATAASSTVPPSTATLIPSATLVPSATLPPTPSPTTTPLGCWTEPGHTELSSLESELLLHPLDYRVHLPPCYDQQPDRRYPVLWMIHGQSYNDDQWDRLGMDETADRLAAAGEITPFIIVMPRDRNWDQPTVDMFGRVVVEELLPYIDGHYRTIPERSFRAVGGLSRGAGWAVHLGIFHWELFGALGGHSLPVFHADTPKLRTQLDAIPSESMPRIYLDIGEKDRPEIMRSALWFEALLTEKGIPHEWYLFPGYHEEAYWQAHIEQYVRWYAQEW